MTTIDPLAEQPLKGIRVIELGTLIAGPYAGVLLAQFGAEVIKIESPGSADPHYRAKEMLEKHTLPDGSPVDFPGIFPKLSGTPGKTRWLGPELGAHTQEVLGSIGIDATKFQSLRTRGVV